MNLAQLRYFLAVAETGSFTKAAERANVTQPTLSVGIKRLEEALGQRLFDRGRLVRLTAAGARFLPRARLMVLEWAAARAELAQSGRTRLRLGYLRTLPSPAVAALFGDFAASHPAIELELIDGEPPQLERLLERGDLDAALSVLGDASGRHPNQALLRQRYVLAVPSGHLLATRTTCRLADLDGLPFVIRPDCEVLRAARRAFAAQGINCPNVARVGDDERLIRLVAAGLGLGIVPDGIVPEGLSTLTITDFPVQRRIGLIWRQTAAKPAQEFLSFAASHPWRELRGTGRQRLDTAH